MRVILWKWPNNSIIISFNNSKSEKSRSKVSSQIEMGSRAFSSWKGENAIIHRHVSLFDIHNWIESLTKSSGVKLNGRTVLALSSESSKACKGDAQIDGYTSNDVVESRFTCAAREGQRVQQGCDKIAGRGREEKRDEDGWPQQPSVSKTRNNRRLN